MFLCLFICLLVCLFVCVCIFECACAYVTGGQLGSSALDQHFKHEFVRADTKKRSGSTPLVALRPPGSKKPTLEADTTAEETPPSSDQLEKSEDEKKMDSISKTKAPGK